MEYFCHVAGVTFEGRQEIVRHVHIGDSVTLRPEPDNPHDANAVMVLWKGEHVGYVPRWLAAIVASKMQGEDIEGTVTDCTGGSADFPNYGLEINFQVKER